MGNQSSNIDSNSDFSRLNSENNIHNNNNTININNNNNNTNNNNNHNYIINNQVKQYLSKLENSYEYNSNNDSNSNSSSYNSFGSHKSKNSTNSCSSNVTVLSILQSNELMNESSSYNNNNYITHSNRNIQYCNHENEVPLYISKTLNNYKTSKIWKGTFENRKCIIKGIKKNNQRSRELFRSEKNALLKLNHPNIVKL